MTARDKFEYWLKTWSDIQAHLPMLYAVGRGFVLELGVRDGVSTAALLAGIETHGGHLWSVDINENCLEVFKGHPFWTFVNADSADYETIHTRGKTPEKFDAVFIDTNHTLTQTLNELKTWGPHVKMGGKILLHDAVTFPEVREAMDIFTGMNGMQMEIIQGSNGLGIITVSKEV